MRVFRYPISVAVALAMTYLFVRLWLSSARSERFWTWLNHQLSAGLNPGLASDLELIVVLIGGFTLSVGLMCILLKAWHTAFKQEMH